MAGLLTSGSTYSPRLPDLLEKISGIFVGFVPGHSGGSVPDSHRIPYRALQGAVRLQTEL
jgi:hypothetical protein